MMTIKDFHETWNKLHIETVKADSANRNSIMALWLENQILQAKEAYYNTGTPIMEDRVYDKMEDYLKTLNPTSSVLEKVGT
jgi:NAD-dependent DNA ligase